MAVQQVRRSRTSVDDGRVLTKDKSSELPRQASVDNAPEPREIPPSAFVVGPLDPRLPKTAQVYEKIRSAIISMRLPPGAPLPEQEICQSLEVSRTPVREAALQLATESLVVVKPGEGTFINRIVLSEVLEGQVTRDTLEMRLLRLAARRFTKAAAGEFEVELLRQRLAAERRDVDEFFALDNAFHRLVCENSGYPKSWRTIHSATGQLDRVRRHAFPTENHFEEVLAEHQGIFDCLRRHDEEGAAAIFQRQLDSTFPSLELISIADPDLILYDVENPGLGLIR